MNSKHTPASASMGMNHIPANGSSGLGRFLGSGSIHSGPSGERVWFISVLDVSLNYLRVGETNHRLVWNRLEPGISNERRCERASVVFARRTKKMLTFIYILSG